MTQLARARPPEVGPGGDEAHRAAGGGQFTWLGLHVDGWIAVLVVLGLVAGLVGIVAGERPALMVVAAVAGSVLVLSAVVNPNVALVLLCVVEFSNAQAVLAVKGSYYALVLVGASSVLLALRDPEMRARITRRKLAPLLLLVVYAAAVLPAIVNSHEPAQTQVWCLEFFKDALLLAIFVLLGLMSERPWWIAATVVATLTTLGAMTIVNQIFLGAVPSTFGGFATVTTATGETVITPRHAGPLADSNFWGRNLILGLPLAYSLVYRSAAAGRVPSKIGWTTCCAVLLGSIYLTQSRGTLLATLVVTALWVIACGPRMRRLSTYVLPLFLLVLLIPGIGNRLLDLDDVFADAPAYTIDPSLVERAAVQKVALVVFEDNPLFGSGPMSFEKIGGGFGAVVSEYAPLAGNVLIGTTTAPHNLYLQLAAESGIVGLVGWLVFTGGLLALAVRAVLRLAGARENGSRGHPTRALAAGTFAAVFGWSVASVFLHLAYFRSLLYVLALLVLVYDSSRRPNGDPTKVANAYDASRRAARTGLVRTAALAAAVLPVAVALLAITGQRQFLSTASFTLLPSPDVWVGYALDVRNRVPVMPVYGTMLQGGTERDEVRVEAEPAKGVITMTSNGGSRDEAERRLATAVSQVPANLARFGGEREYQLVELEPPTTSVETIYPARSLALTGLGVLIELLVLAGVIHRLRLRHQGEPA